MTNTLAAIPATAIKISDGIPRIFDIALAEALGFENSYNIRKLVRHHKSALERFGEVFSAVEKTSKRGGRPGKSFYLNERQAVFLCTKSETEKATDIAIEVVEAFVSLRYGTQAPAALPPQTLTPESQLQLRKAVAEKAKGSRAAYSIIYGFLYDHFKVAKYSQIREADLSAALGFIQGIEISLPELPPPDNASLAFQLDQSVPLTYEQVMADLRRLSDALQRHGYTDATYACQNAESHINRQCGIIQHFHLSVAHYASLSRKPLERKRAA